MIRFLSAFEIATRVLVTILYVPELISGFQMAGVILLLTTHIVFDNDMDSLLFSDFL